jgi:O-antigen ligase
MRRGFLFGIDVLVLYYVVSRTCTSRKAIVEAMASFCLVCAIFVPLALFESLKSWLLYAEIGGVWGTPPTPAYLFRGSTLRAQVSVGHALALGYLMAIAIGFWLYLRSRVPLTPLTKAVALWMCVGLLAAYSKGPWVVAVVIFFTYLALGPNGPARFFKASLILALVAGLVVTSPVGERVIDNLPFIGTVDAENVTYRQRLAELSWQLIQKNPFFGDLFFASHLDELRTGYGIIDLMNAYAAIGMSYGLVGLGLLIGFFVAGMWKAYRLVRRSAGSDADLSLLGVGLIACMLGTLVMMAVGGFGTSVEKMFYILAGLAAGYAQLDQLNEPDKVRRSFVPEAQSGWTLKRG